MAGHHATREIHSKRFIAALLGTGQAKGAEVYSRLTPEQKRQFVDATRQALDEIGEPFKLTTEEAGRMLRAVPVEVKQKLLNGRGEAARAILEQTPEAEPTP